MGEDPAAGRLVQTRSMVIVHVAMHDALNAIERCYAPYAFDGRVAACREGLSLGTRIGALAFEKLIK